MPASEPIPAMPAAAPLARQPHSPRKTLLFTAVHALLFYLAFPSHDLWPLAMIAVAPLTWAAIHSASTFLLSLCVILTQMFMWLVINHWIIDVTDAGYLALCLYMSLFPAIYAWLVRRMVWNPWLLKLPMTLVAPTLWIGVEYLRGDVAFDGYPWFLAGHPMIHWLSFAQSADLFGAYFTGFLAVMVSGLLVDVGRIACGMWPHKGLLRMGGLVLVVLVLNVAYGQWRLSQTAPLSEGPRVLAIQTNLPQDNKMGWSLISQSMDLPAFLELTRLAMRRESRIDLIAWPETMLPGFGFEPATLEFLERLVDSSDRYTRWGREIVKLSESLNTPVLVGSSAWVDVKIADGRIMPGHEYNSAYLIQGKPPYQRYDKTFLTPFGETMPYISAWPWLEEKMMSIGAQGMSFSLSANPEISILNLRTARGEVRLATPICFEDTVGRVCRAMVYEGGVKRADLMVNLSNDGWFGTNDDGRRQHLQIARFRCIENRVPMIRCVNTGVTAAIDSMGKMADPAGEGRYPAVRTSDWLAAEPMLDGRRTVYGRIGEAWGRLCLALAALLLTASFFKPAQHRRPRPVSSRI